MRQAVKEHKALGERIIDDTIDRARGRKKDYCLFERPRRNFFVSNMSPKDAAEADEYSESRPASMGLRVKPESSELEIEIEFDLFVRSFPRESEYDEIKNRKFEESSLFYRRTKLNYSTEFDLNDKENELGRVNSELKEEIESTIESFREEILFFSNEVNLSDEKIEDKNEISSIRDRISESEEIKPEWSVQFDIEEKENELYISLTNTSPNDENQDDRITDNYIFNPKISLNGEFTEYILTTIPEDYRYDQKIWGKGQNCSVEVDDKKDPKKIKTTAVPKKQLYRFVHNQEHSDLVSLDNLSSGNVLDYLKDLEEEMGKYLSRWRRSKRREMKGKLSEDELESYDKAADRFEEEIENFSRGLDALDKKDVRRAFKLMNEAFKKRDDEIESWRLFQIVFIVSNLGSIASREHDDIEDRSEEAEVLWFPTGGGKTEAYQGLIVTALFFDRIRGKNQGVSSWIRFPLRLLGKQQKERMLGILLEAEEIRKNELDGKGEEFSLGYYVGGQDTPNKICSPENDDCDNDLSKKFKESHERVKEDCKVLDNCPKCEGNVRVEYKEDLNSVFHYCDGDCEIEKIPLHVTDNDIYRYVPSVLLGTLDKITISGLTPKFTNLLGNFTSKCPLHNYGYSGKCSEGNTIGCDYEDKNELKHVDEEVYDPVPTLHLIDEVHLLEEELGVFAAHYETLYQKLCELIGGETPKVITSTATISNYEQQMDELFCKEANRFPVEGPTLGESFYGEKKDGREDDIEEIPERKYFGITPYNKTHIYAVLDLVKYMHESVRDLRNKEADEFDIDIDNERKREILQMYELSIVYFLKKTGKDRFRRSIRNQIKREMKQEGYDDPITVEQLTGDVDDLGILDDLKNAEGEFEERDDCITATSFISHGIDIDRFNNMFFFGFPSETFQYIQSSSRVGRDEEIPGFVVDIFKPFQERDKHRFKYFEKTHEYLRRLVEPISIDRWSKRGIDETFPGIFQGLFINYYRPLYYEEYDLNVQSSSDLGDIALENEYKYTIEGGKTLRESMKQNLEDAFGIEDKDNSYVDRIDNGVRDNWSYWESDLGEEYWTTYRRSAMRSLRDIGESVSFSVKNNQFDFYKYLSVGGEK
jgi:hypothetical protein